MYSIYNLFLEFFKNNKKQKKKQVRLNTEFLKENKKRQKYAPKGTFFAYC